MTTDCLYTHRYVLRAVIEFTTPFLVGAGRKGDTADAVFVSDANGFPALPGSSIAGVLRARFRETFSADDEERLFGFQKGDEGEGSRLTVSWGCIHDCENAPVEGIVPLQRHDDPVLAKARIPSIRDHVRINHKGASSAEEHGKFDEQAVCAGHRFTFELELSGTAEESPLWEKLLSLLSTIPLRFGGKTRRGYGACRLVSLKGRIFDLRSDFDSYIKHPVALSEPSPLLEEIDTGQHRAEKGITLSLSPCGFWMIGGGYDLPEQRGDADMAPLRDCRIVWSGDGAKVEDDLIVIPAASVKGALSHRVAFHYNALKGIFSDTLSPEIITGFCGEGNTAVRELFGFSKERDISVNGPKETNSTDGKAGRVFIDDIYLSRDHLSRLVPHVGIDRFTGGARDQVLFSERPLWKGNPIDLRIVVADTTNMEDRDNVLKAFRSAVLELAEGNLQLGAGSGRGLGYFRADAPVEWPDYMKTAIEG